MVPWGRPWSPKRIVTLMRKYLPSDGRSTVESFYNTKITNTRMQQSKRGRGVIKKHTHAHTLPYQKKLLSSQPNQRARLVSIHSDSGKSHLHPLPWGLTIFAYTWGCFTMVLFICECVLVGGRRLLQHLPNYLRYFSNGPRPKSKSHAFSTSVKTESFSSQSWQQITITVSWHTIAHRLAMMAYPLSCFINLWPTSDIHSNHHHHSLLTPRMGWSKNKYNHAPPLMKFSGAMANEEVNPKLRLRMAFL